MKAETHEVYKKKFKLFYWRVREDTMGWLHASCVKEQ